MKQAGFIITILLIGMLSGCKPNNSGEDSNDNVPGTREIKSDTLTKHLKPFKSELPTIGLLMYSGVLQSELFAT